MEGMKQFPDKYFDLAIVDPPYGDVKAGGYMNGKSAGGVGPHPKYHYAIWKQEKPKPEYFKELFRVSKNQIIWGGNYFAVEIGKDSPCWIIWDKCNGNTKWADCELAWTSFNTAARMFRFMWNGMLQGKSISEGHLMQGNKSLNEIRIHPTQKPVKLYEWILSEYAHSGDIILDTHVGSASSLVACYQRGFNYVGFENDLDYFQSASERLEVERSQVTMF
jgi:site-specific DNA-methyltransferase (adenine-specific)